MGGAETDLDTISRALDRGAEERRVIALLEDHVGVEETRALEGWVTSSVSGVESGEYDGGE